MSEINDAFKRVMQIHYRAKAKIALVCLGLILLYFISIWLFARP